MSRLRKILQSDLSRPVKINGVLLTGIIFALLAVGCFLAAGSAYHEDSQVALFAGGFGVASLVVGSILISYARVAARCPECSSLKSKPVWIHGYRVRVFSDRECSGCGAAWTPATPRSVAVLLVVGGAAMAVGLGWASIEGIKTIANKSGGAYLIWPFGTVAGLIIFSYGLSVLLGKAGKIKIHKKGNSNDA
jgi:hypothetical protein